MPTVAEVVKEYLEKQKNEYESIVIVIGGDKHCFKNVTNLVQVETGEYEFDFVHVPLFEKVKGKNEKMHIKCMGKIIMSVKKLEE